MQWAGNRSLLEKLGTRLLEVGESTPLISHSYLNDNDRANPDIIANVSAITKVCGYLAFVAEDDNGNVMGYWFGPDDVPIERAPIVRLDTEGQFKLLGGSTLSEAILGNQVFDDDERFTQLRRELSKSGIAVVATSWAHLTQPRPNTLPNDLHTKLYNDSRVAAGLPPVGV